MSAAAESAILASLVTSLSSLAALAISRVRCRRVRDENGDIVCLSACSEHALVDSEELSVERYTLGDKELVLVSSKMLIAKYK